MPRSERLEEAVTAPAQSPVSSKVPEAVSVEPQAKDTPKSESIVKVVEPIVVVETSVQPTQPKMRTEEPNLQFARSPQVRRLMAFWQIHSDSRLHPFSLTSFFLLLLQAVKPHLPMIRFRKGSLIPQAALPETTMVAASPAASSSTSKEAGKWQPDQIVNLEWWQTPEKFKRRYVDDLEVDLINVSFGNHFKTLIDFIPCSLPLILERRRRQTLSLI